VTEVQRELRTDDGARIAYRVTPAIERRPGRAVLLLHGLASNLTRWSEFVEHTSLSRRWDVIRVDLRGHGGSIATQPAIGRRLTLERWCSDLAAILDAEGHPAGVIAGHSLGAQVALHFTVSHPARITALALIDPVFRAALRGRWRLIGRLGPLLAGGAVLVRALNAAGLRRRNIPALDLRALDLQAREALRTGDGGRAFVRHYSSMRADLRTFRTADYLEDAAELFRPTPVPAAIAVPVLTLLSASGTFADPAASARVAAGFPRGSTVGIDCHHWPLTERPEEVRAAIERWCAALDAPCA